VAARAAVWSDAPTTSPSHEVPSVPTILSVNGHTPQVAAGAYLAETSVVAGDVRIADRASLWFGCVVRSEHTSATIGADSNLQDLTVVHTDADYPVTIGDRVTVGHRAILHGCTIEDDALIGMGAVVLNGAVIGAGAIVGAGAVIREGMEVPPRTLAVGVPAKVLDREVPAPPRPNVASYLALAGHYRASEPAER
jgi:carbonic anhydrase/acetyltransferase-like protein (isoleucine patch superfamily)